MADLDPYGEKPQTRDLSSYFDGMRAWVETRLGKDEPAAMTSLQPTPAGANGFAGESFILDVAYGANGAARSARYLLKRKPTQHKYFPEHDFAAEYRAQETVGRAKLAPVAHVKGYEDDTSVLGSPFYLISFVKGRPVPDFPNYFVEGWLRDAGPEAQRAVSTAGLSALAQLHAKPLAALGAEFLHRGKSGAQIDWDLGLWDRFAAVAWKSEPLGRVSEGRAWLEQNKPTEGPLVISWGDARPGNIMFDGARCAAIIDWDMVSAGDPEKDLGYLLAMDLQAERSATGGSRLEGWPGRAEMVAIYERAAGKPVDQKKLRYHRIFAAYQIACMFARYISMRRDLDDGARAQYLNEKSPPLDLMREELDAAHLPGNAT